MPRHKSRLSRFRYRRARPHMPSLRTSANPSLCSESTTVIRSAGLHPGSEDCRQPVEVIHIHAERFYFRIPQTGRRLSVASQARRTARSEPADIEPCGLSCPLSTLPNRPRNAAVKRPEADYCRCFIIVTQSRGLHFVPAGIARKKTGPGMVPAPSNNPRRRRLTRQGSCGTIFAPHRRPIPRLRSV